MSEQTNPPAPSEADKAAAEAEAKAKAKADADAKAAADKAAADAKAEAEAKANSLPKLAKGDAFFAVEIPGCWSGQMIVVAADDQEATDRYTAHHGIHSYDKPAIVNKVKSPDVCHLPRESDQPA
jgi:regulator of protease activity HflC (stomatin/prohibitin superfamily)